MKLLHLYFVECISGLKEFNSPVRFLKWDPMRKKEVFKGIHAQWELIQSML